MAEKIITGIPAAPGIAMGIVHLFRHDDPVFREYSVLEKDRQAEIVRLEEAIQDTQQQLTTLRESMEHQVGETIAQIFEAQSVFLIDDMYIGDIRNNILTEGINAESAVFQATQKIAESLSALEGEQFQQRSKDIQDVGQRVVRNLLGGIQGALEPLKRPSILVADDLLPSDVVHLLNNHILAVATDLGGATSHTAILTRSLQVPAVVGLKNLSRTMDNGERIIVNGNSGKVIIQPERKTIRNYNRKRAHYVKYVAGLRDLNKLPAETLDHHIIELKANLELPQEVRSVISHGAGGIGLFRSEYLFLARKRIPNEEDQLESYLKVIRALSPLPVTIRTFDLGGDKVFPNLPHPVETNPFMGWRAVRVSLDRPNLLLTQLRAILRAAVAGPTKIMFPFISGLKQVRQVKEYVEEAKQQLSAGGFAFNPGVEIGIMIELPSAVIMADRLAREVDFFSIGTNDLVQFTLAVDRGNELISKYYQPLHPAVVRMLKMTVDAGHDAGIKVGICGEFAANPLGTMLLVGLGMDELSVSPVALPEIKKLIRSMTYQEAKDFAKQALKFETVEELHTFCLDSMKHRFADLPIWFNGETRE